MSKKITAYGQIKDGSLRLSYIDKFKTAVRSLPNGRYKLVLSKIYNKRSNQQNNFLWGVIYPIVRDGLVEIGYSEFRQDTDCEDTHDYCKYLFLKREIVNEKTGEVKEIPGSTRGLTTTGFMEYMEDINRWASEYLGVVIPDPDPNYADELILNKQS